MSLLGYPPHARSGSRVVASTHLSTHLALRLAQDLGCTSGWLQTSDDLPHLEGIAAASEPVFVDLGDLFLEQRVAYTEGIVSGSVLLATAPAADPPPPRGRSLVDWTESCGRPWLEVIDNEYAYFGALDDQRQRRLLCWFLSARPLDIAWQDTELDHEAAAILLSGLFEHGWTRNVSLVMTGWRPSVDLWGGIHRTSPLEHDELKRLSGVQRGVRLTLRGSTWVAKLLGDEDCPLDDRTGRATPSL